MPQSHDVQPTSRTREEILEGMHQLATRLKPHDEVSAVALQIQTVATIDGHVTKSESKNAK